MVEISAPLEVTRGSTFSGTVMINPEELGRAKEVRVTLENQIIYPNPCKQNFSSWSQIKKFSVEEVRRNTQINYEFTVPPVAPPTYTGKNLDSSWHIKITLDIPLWFDKNMRQPITVKR